MSKSKILPLLLLAGACAAPRAASDTPEANQAVSPAGGPRVFALEADDGSASDANATHQPGAPEPVEAAFEPPVAKPVPQAARERHLGADELALWNDPRFKRRFAESYLAESEVEPTVTADERDVLLEVLEFISANEMDKALALMNKERDDTSSAVFDFTEGNIHFQRDELQPALRAYEAAVDKYPKYLRAWKNLGLIHVREGAPEKAAKAFTRVIELGGGDSLTYGLLGYAYSNLANHLSSETAYRMAVLLDPETMDWKMGLARSLFQQKRYADAVALCDSLIAAEPERADLWLLQANAFIGLEQPLRAAENYELVDRLGGSTPDSLNMLGDIYVNEEIFDLAVDSYVRALGQSEGVNVERPIRAARVLTARGALDETRTLVEAIEAGFGAELEDDQRKDLLKLRARLAVADGAGEEEARVLEEIVALDPLDGEALILLGRHAGRAGDVEKAIFWYERAAALEQFEADAKVGHAQLLVGKGRYDEALPLLRKAQQLEPRENVQTYLDQVERVARGR